MTIAVIMVWTAIAAGLTALDVKQLRSRGSKLEWIVYIGLMSGALLLICLIECNMIHFSMVELFMRIYSPVGKWLTNLFGL